MELALVGVVQAHSISVRNELYDSLPYFVMAYLRVLPYPSASTSPFSINL